MNRFLEKGLVIYLIDILARFMQNCKYSIDHLSSMRVLLNVTEVTDFELFAIFLPELLNHPKWLYMVSSNQGGEELW